MAGSSYRGSGGGNNRSGGFSSDHREEDRNVRSLNMSLRRFGSGARQDRVGARANSSVVIPGREEIDPFVGHLVDQAVFAIDPA